jgi:hypothetical protein
VEDALSAGVSFIQKKNVDPVAGILLAGAKVRAVVM